MPHHLHASWEMEARRRLRSWTRRARAGSGGFMDSLKESEPATRGPESCTGYPDWPTHSKGPRELPGALKLPYGTWPWETVMLTLLIYLGNHSSCSILSHLAGTRLNCSVETSTTHLRPHGKGCNCQEPRRNPPAPAPGSPGLRPRAQLPGCEHTSAHVCEHISAEAAMGAACPGMISRDHHKVLKQHVLPEPQ